MSRTKHTSKGTPGPWERDGDLIVGPPDSGTDYHDGDCNRAVICQQYASCERWDDDSALIIAAKDLLAVAERLSSEAVLHPVGRGHGGYSGASCSADAILSLRAVIAKAKGK